MSAAGAYGPPRTQKGPPVPRLAATVLVLARDPTADQDFKVLFVERSVKSGFFPSRHVFPGGLIEAADGSADWSAKYSADALRARSIADGLSPQVDSLGSRVGVLRELFEETGLMLARGAASPAPSQAPGLSSCAGGPNGGCGKYPGCYAACGLAPPSSLSSELSQARKAVHGDAKHFLQLCDESKLVPEVESLIPWSRWITPIGEGSRRYDTWFYLAPLPFDAPPPKASPDGVIGETVSTSWLSPKEAVAACRAKKMMLAPPTLYVLEELSRHRLICDVVREAQRRTVRPTLPLLDGSKEGFVTILLPGDPQWKDTSDQPSHGPAPSGPRYQRHRVLMELATGAVSTDVAIEDEPSAKL